MQTQTELFVGTDVVEDLPPVHLDTEGEVWSLVVDASLSWEEVRLRIADDLESQADELHGRNLRLNLGARKLDLMEVRRVSTLLRDGFKAAIIGLECDPDSVHRYAETAFKMPVMAPAIDTRPRMPLVFTGAPFADLEDDFVETLEEGDDAVPTDVPELDADPTDLPELSAAGADGEEDVVEIYIGDEGSEDLDSEMVDRLAEDFMESLGPDAEVSLPDGTAGDVIALVDEPSPDLHADLSGVDELIEVETTDIIELGAPVPAEGGRRLMVLEKTLRSGKTIRFAGDVMVYGDVNAGAHIEADGNITVFGSLRGLAHAGARGDARAVIISFDLGAPQLRIADHIGFATAAPAPVEEEPQGFAKLSGDVVGGLSSLLGRSRQPARAFNPEIAWVEGGEIRIGSYQGRLPS